MSILLPGQMVRRSATAHGWLRRPELDTASYEVWERPDGVLHPHPRPDESPFEPDRRHPVIVEYRMPSLRDLAGEFPDR